MYEGFQALLIQVSKQLDGRSKARTPELFDAYRRPGLVDLADQEAVRRLSKGKFGQ